MVSKRLSNDSCQLCSSMLHLLAIACMTVHPPCTDVASREALSPCITWSTQAQEGTSQLRLDKNLVRKPRNSRTKTSKSGRWSTKSRFGTGRSISSCSLREVIEGIETRLLR